MARPVPVGRGFIPHRGEAEGRTVEHVDVHSLGRTFAANRIVSGADPEAVRQLPGYRTLDRTVKVCRKVHNRTKRQALAKLTYGGGTLAPDQVVEHPASGGFPVPVGHQPSPGPGRRRRTDVSPNLAKGRGG